MSLLIYAYAHGVFSSRRIEQLTYENLCVRYLFLVCDAISFPMANTFSCLNIHCVFSTKVFGS